MYACIYRCMCVCVCVCVSVRVCVWACESGRARVCLSVGMSMYLRRYVCMYACSYLSIYLLGRENLLEGIGLAHSTLTRYSVLAGHALGTHTVLGPPQRYSGLTLGVVTRQWALPRYY